MPQSLDPASRPFVLVLAVAALLAGCGGGPDGGAPDKTLDDPAAHPFADGDGTPVADVDDPAPGAGEPASSEDPATAAAAADAASDNAIRTVGALERLAAAAFVELAGALETGRPLKAAERACLVDHDPSTGLPPTVLSCAIPLYVGGTPVSVRGIELDPDEACLAAMGDTARDVTSVVDACAWLTAAFTLDVEWIAPNGTGPERRPRALDGAELDYAASSGTLALRSPTRPLTGEFDCRIDVPELALDDGGDETCATRLAGLAERLERHAQASDAGT